MKYDQAFEDWEYLWAIAPADDMTGAYVDQEDLDKLLRNPTKKVAASCLCSQIDHWFYAGPSSEDGPWDFRDLSVEHPKLLEIAERHGAFPPRW